MTPDAVLMIVVLAIVAAVVVSGAGIFGWVHTTKLKIRHGYPLQSMWGQPLRPTISTEADERVRLVTQENAQLRAELGSLKDRLGTVERIVTDSGYHLTHEIERLRKKDEVQ